MTKLCLSMTSDSLGEGLKQQYFERLPWFQWEARVEDLSMVFNLGLTIHHFNHFPTSTFTSSFSSLSCGPWKVQPWSNPTAQFLYSYSEAAEPCWRKKSQNYQLSLEADKADKEVSHKVLVWWDLKNNSKTHAFGIPIDFCKQ